MEDCIFCKIVKGEIPSDKVYEDDTCLAFLNIHPNNEGQALLIPKNHYSGYFDTPDELLQYLSIKAKYIGEAIRKAMEAEGMNIIINSKKAGGQVIFHTHFHIIPRYSKDGYKHWNPKKNYDASKAPEIAKKIIQNL